MEISKMYNVSRSLITKIRRKNNIKSTKGKIVDEKVFIELHRKGYSDSLIAETLGVSRGLVVKTRKKLGLAPNFDKGSRSAGKLRDDMPLYYEARRALRNPDVEKAVRTALREYFKKINESNLSEDKKREREIAVWATTIIDPSKVFHPAPGSYVTPVEKMNLTAVRYMVDFEIRSDFAGICGVPSPELLKRAIDLKGADDPSLVDMVGMSGYVGIHETVAGVVMRKNPDSVGKWSGIWNRYRDESEEWAPLKTETNRRVFRIPNKRSSNGKKGKGGGCQNLETRRAFAGIMGY
ncbi:MAG: hypothetical protein K6U74_05005 [Firmicutes bacterium]|nr:hypothetical protein [Bacillota bacterium]